MEEGDRINGARDGEIVMLERHVREWKGMVLVKGKRSVEFGDEERGFLRDGCAEEGGRWVLEERGRYEEVIGKLEGRIRELEDGRGGCLGSGGEETRRGRGGEGEAGGNERGKERKMEGGMCVVS